MTFRHLTILLLLITNLPAFTQSNQVHYSASLGFGFIEEFSFKKEVSALLNPTLFDCGCYNSLKFANDFGYKWCSRSYYLSFGITRNYGKIYELVKLDYYKGGALLGIQGSSIKLRYVQLGYYYGRTIKSWANNRLSLTPVIGLMGRYGYDEFYVDYGSESQFSNLRRRLADVALSFGSNFTYHFHRRFSLTTKLSYDRWVFILNNHEKPKSVFGDKASNQVNLQFSVNYRFYTKDLDK